MRRGCGFVEGTSNFVKSFTEQNTKKESSTKPKTWSGEMSFIAMAAKEGNKRLKIQGADSSCKPFWQYAE